MGRKRIGWIAVIACAAVALGAFCYVVAAVVRNDVVDRFRLLNMNAREISRAMWENEDAKKMGKAWVDPSGCTNSTQFIRALWDKFHDGAAECRYADAWCVAVNPPDDESFPVLVTANVDPVGLLNGQDMDAPIELACPEGWNGVFSGYPKRSMFVVLRSGSVLAMTKKADQRLFCRRLIFYPARNPPRPNPDTYFLTPTGRLDFVVRPPVPAGN